MEHEGTKYEHSSTNVPVENRGQFNYCLLCNGWFPRQHETEGARMSLEGALIDAEQYGRQS